MSASPLVPYDDRYDPRVPPDRAAREFHEVLRRRRSVRHFSSRSVSRETVEWIVRCATTAPSGANRQPWRFVCVANPALKREIRLAAEAEERRFYQERASEAWIQDLEPLQTRAKKPFLEAAPWLIAVFRLSRGDDGNPVYYSPESVGLAVGHLLVAAHVSGLSTLVYTPSPMGFLVEILKRPPHERPFVLIPLGYPANDCKTPMAARERKPLQEVMIVHD